MTIDAPRFPAETSGAYHLYERASMADDIPAKNAWVHEVVITNRHHLGEVFREIEKIRVYREVRRASPRQLLGRPATVVDGDGFVTVDADLLRERSEHGDLQKLTWGRFGDGRKVVSGNASLEDCMS